MIQQKCAICEKNNFSQVYSANFDARSLNTSTFSARRMPDRVHYQIVRCNDCGLLYSTPILEQEKIEKLYKQSFMSYDSHVANLQKTYGHYLSRLESYGAKKGKILEIGCGNGFFLEEAKRQGYEEVYGIEPGKKSVEKAKSDIQKNITIDVFKPGIYKKNFFDVVCCFQTLDHIIDPNSLLKEVYNILKKDGFVLFLNHNEASFSSILFKEKSPIIDIEHTYLFNKKTMRMLFEKHGFKVFDIASSFNIHTMSYLVQLFPIPNALKKFTISCLNKTGLGKISLKLYLGNIVLIGQK